jgi:hypothetical protein
MKQAARAAAAADHTAVVAPSAASGYDEVIHTATSGSNLKRSVSFERVDLVVAVLRDGPAGGDDAATTAASEGSSSM